MRDSDLIDQHALESVINDCDKLLKLLGSTKKTMKDKNPNS